jgi:hypothetical protein
MRSSLPKVLPTEVSSPFKHTQRCVGFKPMLFQAALGGLRLLLVQGWQLSGLNLAH